MQQLHKTFIGNIIKNESVVIYFQAGMKGDLHEYRALRGYHAQGR